MPRGKLRNTVIPSTDTDPYPMQGLARRKANMHRAMSVDLGHDGERDTSPFSIEDSFRRAEAARAMSMDASHVPGVEGWPVPHALLTGILPFPPPHFQFLCGLHKSVPRHIQPPNLTWFDLPHVLLRLCTFHSLKAA